MDKIDQKYTPHLQNIDLQKFLTTNYNESPEMKAISHRISVAPMMDITDVHFRFFMRLLTKHSILYTEMIHENAVMNVKEGVDKFLRFNPVEHPVVIQLGGNNPEILAKCAKISEDMGYDEVNINIGCPSERVQSGAFGACLMKEPELVAECVAAMQKAVKIPVTIKTRLGVDNLDSYEFAHDFIKKTSEKSQTSHYIMHARKAFLKGLNPAENRNIPPLHYDRVVRLKADFPHIDFSINGGFKTIETIQDILKPEHKLVGCMIGRVTYDNPWILADVDRLFYGQKNLGYSRREILEIYAEYGQKQIDEGWEKSFPTLTKPVLNLFAFEKGTNKYRQALSNTQMFKDKIKYRDFIHNAIQVMESLNPEALDRRPPLDEPSETNKETNSELLA